MVLNCWYDRQPDKSHEAVDVVETLDYDYG